MSDKTLEVIYSRQRTNFAEGKIYSNPRFFTTPRSGVTKVYLVGEWPNIRKAYEALGVPVEQIDAEQVQAQERFDLDLTPPPLAAQVALSERSNVVIPENWRELQWIKIDETTGENMRTLASKFSDTPVLNKPQAVAAIEAELQRRATA